MSTEQSEADVEEPAKPEEPEQPVDIKSLWHKMIDNDCSFHCCNQWPSSLSTVTFASFFRFYSFLFSFFILAPLLLSWRLHTPSPMICRTINVTDISIREVSSSCHMRLIQVPSVTMSRNYDIPIESSGGTERCTLLSRDGQSLCKWSLPIMKPARRPSEYWQNEETKKHALSLVRWRDRIH